MQRRPAGSDLNRVKALEVGFCDVRKLVEKHATCVERDAAFDSFANGARLLVNLLEHEMLEAAFFRLDRIPGDALHLRLDRIAVEVSDAYRILRHHGDLTVAEKKDVSRVLKNGRNVGSDKVFAIAEANDYRVS